MKDMNWLAIYPELTATENLAYFGRLQGLRGAALTQRTGEVLDLVGLALRAPLSPGAATGAGAGPRGGSSAAIAASAEELPTMPTRRPSALSAG